jgi:hypothetical protein
MMDWILLGAVILLGIGLYGHRLALDHLADRISELEERCPDPKGTNQE